MCSVLQIFIFIPILGFLISILIPEKEEAILSRVAFFTVGTNFAILSVFAVFWLRDGHPNLNLKELVIFQNSHYEFFIDFFFDKITAVYFAVGSFLTFLVTIYSRTYMHREIGYKRFFNTILLFYLGYNITIFSGNFETLFIGWEILGISSFLLIAFYRNRYLPVKNALKVFSVYRIGDIGLILAMWASHHLWHENITFLKLQNAVVVNEHIDGHSVIGTFISFMILVAAAAKSAQLPFSSWLPRAMEGPTPSSAIFYGSLSVHLGAFLLLRTFPFWEHQTYIRVLIVLLGLSTALVGTLIARVQSSVKSQIAYSSVAQIGLIFIEIALGWDELALFHFAGNAFLRTYQLLVSPSVVSYMIREQFYNYVPRQFTFEDSFPKKLEYSIYLLSLKEWNLDLFIEYILWKPLKNAGKLLNFLNVRILVWIFVPTYIVGLGLLGFEESVSPIIKLLLPGLFSAIGFLMVLKSFSERRSPILSWLLLIMNYFWLALAISFNEHFALSEAIFYLSGAVICGGAGVYVLLRLAKEEGSIHLNSFLGHSYEHPKLALAFLICGLGLMGFPITPTFIGEDLVFSHIHSDQIFLAHFTAMSFVIGGISVVRMYARLFLGPHAKTYHETPYKSS